MTNRQEFTTRTKAAAFRRANGCCEACGVKLGAGKAAPEYDHKLSCEEGGDNSIQNCAVLCGPCHGLKTHKIEAPAKAQGRRNLMKHHGQTRSRFPLPGGRGGKWKRKIDGTVERRDA